MATYGRMLAAAVAAAMLASSALAADKIRIGFLTTLTTPAAIVGEDQRKAVELALDHIGRKMGALEVEIVYADDEFNPQKGKQATEKLVTSDKVDLIAGYLWSNVLLASAPVVLDADKILISANAGPSQLAGKDCHPNFFNVSWQNDQTPMAMGELLNQKGVKSLYTISPNYAAGKDMVAGVRRTFKGTVVGEDYTTWPAQMDWAAEFTKAKAAKPDGVFAFYPGAHGPAFLKQYEQAGMHGIPLYTVYTIDAISLPRLQQAKMDHVLGTVMTQFWVQDLDNAQNKRFVADFKAKHKTYPSFYAA
ncbi:MAG: ABC transporter substrate-binding protein, partial [Alphaproteobacteria bacterium]|nr:ABC transporter substrate-binding protein [Alphaproteobacteria bacterium]